MQQSAPDPGASPELQTLNSPATASDHSQRAFPTPFLTKTYQLVDDPELDDLISWGSDGSTFVVWRPNEFARDILPKHFKHNNFSSFVRQLNTYGFRKIVPDRWEFSNDGFKRGEKRLLRDIQRRKNNIPPSINPTRSPSNSGEEQVLSSNSTPSVAVAVAIAAPPPGTTAELLDENERLRKQNQALSQDLARMKNICNSIFVLMSKYSSDQQETQHETIDLLRGEGVMEVKVEEVEEGCSWRSPMLFGVSIGEKRKKGLEEEKLEESGSGAELGLGLSPEVENRRPWVVYCPRPRRVGDERTC